MRRVHSTITPGSPVPLLYVDNGGCYGGIFDSPGRVTFALCDDDHPGWGSTIRFGNPPTDLRYVTPVSPGDYEGPTLVPSVPPFPPAPTRDQVLGVTMHFMGGLIVESPVYGKMPWWDSALSWCDPATRVEAYRVKHAAGDTHAIIEVPNGLPLYDEPNQFYSPDTFGPLDWTAGETRLDHRFLDLVYEVVANGFTFIVGMDERVRHSQRIVTLVMEALGGLWRFGFVIPGYDAVFYGWDPKDVVRWATLARAVSPDCYLGMEHNPGHIPLGTGPQDYRPGGLMDGFDLVLGEFDENIRQDSTWQVLGRMVRPYRRPPEQPAGDDPTPPFYLVDSPRGPRSYCAFETFNPYRWVRINPNDAVAVAQIRAELERERAYFRACGCQWTG